ncbi:MAG: extracellular solute-binding protein [Verrucomicrobia subdivision 3 bacterium]|nr:extracellular solute-binding protein [Limisphaerales bacterium]
MRFVFLILAVAGLIGCKPSNKLSNTVVVYTSVDDVFARPVCEQFQKQTGIEVKLVPDTEETKSTGLLNRLIAEKARPVADVFWSGDPVRAAVLKAKGISAPFKAANPADATGRFSDSAGHWSALSARARVLIVNTNLVPVSDAPRSLNAFLDPKWKGKACLANPLFGTTSMHAAALFETMGEAKAKEFFEGLRANGVKMLSSNGEVKRRVAAGELAFGLTDTDDASVAMKEGKAVAMIYPDQDGAGTLIVPNAAVLIANGPNPERGKKFIEYLLTAAVEQSLAESEAAQMPLRPGVTVPSGVKRVEEIKTMAVDYEKLGARLEELSAGFLRTWAASP